MRNIQLVLICVLLLISYSGCEIRDSTRIVREVDSLNIVVDSLNNTIDSLIYEIDDLNSSMYLVERAVSRSAVLDPAEDGYSVLTTIIGPIAFDVLDTEPNASGSTITLAIGNLTVTRLSRMEFQITCSRTDTVSLEYENTSFAITNTLRPGYWRKREVQVSGIRPRELAEIRIFEDESPQIVYNYE